MPQLTLAYIGNGKSTNRYHLPYVDELDGIFTVKSIYVRHFNFTWPRRDNIHYTTDLAEILEDPEVDIVVVTTPMDSHYDYVKAALLAGKHVLCEKPFVQTSAQARELFDLAEERELHLECFQNRRYDSDYLTVLEVLESGALGQPLEMELHFDYFRPEVPEGVDHFSLETSFLYSHACHTLDQVIAAFGRPSRVVYDVRSLLGEGRMNDYFDLDLFYDRGFGMGSFKVSVKSSYFRLVERPSMVVYGTDGTFIKAHKDRQEADLKAGRLPGDEGFGLDRPEDYGLLTTVGDDGQPVTRPVESVPGDYGRVYEALADVLDFGALPQVEPEQTLWQLEILEAGIQALQGKGRLDKKTTRRKGRS